MKHFLFFSLLFFFSAIRIIAQDFAKAEDSLLRIIRQKSNGDSVIAKAYLELIAKSAALQTNKDSLYIARAESFFRAFPANKQKLDFGMTKMAYAKRRYLTLELISICNENIRLAGTLRDTMLIGRAMSVKALSMFHNGLEKEGVSLQKTAMRYLDKKDTNVISRAEQHYLLGWMLFNIEKSPEGQRASLQYFKDAYRMIKDLPGNFEQKAEYAGWVSNAYNATKEFDAAIMWRRKAITHAREDANEFMLGDSYRYLSNTYSRMNRYDSSLIYGHMALESFIKHKIPSRVNVMTNSMATIYLKTGQTEKARKLLEAILDDPDYNNDSYFYDLSLKTAAQLYKKTGDLARANRLYEMYMTHADSMETVKELSKITELNLKSEIETAELKYEFEQNKKEEQFLKEKQKATIIRNALIAGSLLFLLLILVLFRSNHSKKKANTLLHHQKGEIEYQKKEIQDSINYARNIQLASLPNEASIKQAFTGHFILYKPKDVISGDFYWFHQSDDPLATHPLFIAAADCTGHGVPGAFMSMLGADCLDSIIMEKHTLDVGKALSGVNRKIKSTLSQSDQEDSIRDGMDIALCAFNSTFTEVQYAGAHRPLYLVRQKELIEYKATKQSIGGFTEFDQEFATHTIALQKGDMIYLASDGYADQFGGDKGKKFTTARFKELLISLSTKDCEEQKQFLDHTIENWKGRTEQLDDIMIIGIRV